MTMRITAPTRAGRGAGSIGGGAHCAVIAVHPWRAWPDVEARS